MELRSDSTEFVTATVTADHDITGRVIEVALPLAGTAPSTWYTAEVVSVLDTGNAQWKATYRILVGPTGAVTLTPGTYDWIVKVTDSPEIPVRLAGTVTIT